MIPAGEIGRLHVCPTKIFVAVLPIALALGSIIGLPVRIDASTIRGINNMKDIHFFSVSGSCTIQ